MAAEGDTARRECTSKLLTDLASIRHHANYLQRRRKCLSLCPTSCPTASTSRPCTGACRVVCSKLQLQQHTPVSGNTVSEHASRARSARAAGARASCCVACVRLSVRGLAHHHGVTSADETELRVRINLLHKNLRIFLTHRWSVPDAAQLRCHG